MSDESPLPPVTPPPASRQAVCGIFIDHDNMGLSLAKTRRLLPLLEETAAASGSVRWKVVAGKSMSESHQQIYQTLGYRILQVRHFGRKDEADDYALIREMYRCYFEACDNDWELTRVDLLSADGGFASTLVSLADLGVGVHAWTGQGKLHNVYHDYGIPVASLESLENVRYRPATFTLPESGPFAAVVVYHNSVRLSSDHIRKYVPVIERQASKSGPVAVRIAVYVADSEQPSQAARQAYESLGYQLFEANAISPHAPVELIRQLCALLGVSGGSKLARLDILAGHQGLIGTLMAAHDHGAVVRVWHGPNLGWQYGNYKSDGVFTVRSLADLETSTDDSPIEATETPPRSSPRLPNLPPSQPGSAPPA